MGGGPFPINHVITIDFGGFRRAIDYIGCVYVDIDRDYFNDQGGPGGFAVIDIAPGNLKRLARVFGRYFDRDKTLDNKKEVFKFAKTVLFTADNPVREVRFRVTDAPDRVNLVASESMLRKTISEFMNAKASETAREQTEPTAADIKASRERAKRSKNKASEIEGLEEARAEGENQAIVGARKIDFPFYFPTLRTSFAAYQGQEPRTYSLRDEQGRKHAAYRLVLAKGVVGEYYGVQGTTWRHPPILDDPHDTRLRAGRKL